MREVNFSIPNVNKASVGITAALYDRRALDCTSTLPLINSLNHLAYLTTSSARIRDILTVDGGIERLVVILKEGRSKDLMSMWKWNLAFQCVVNIGVRGSETVRTRVVEADMVPVIATILDNYIQVIEKVRAKADAANKRTVAMRSRDGRQSFDRAISTERSIRRPSAPNAIEIPPPPPQSQFERSHDHFLLSNARRRPGMPVYQQSNGRPDHRSLFAPAPSRADQNGMQSPGAVPPTMDGVAMGGFGALQPVRDADRLPSMLSAGGPSQPVSPTTPNPPVTGQAYSRAIPRNPRPTIRHQRSISGESDGGEADDLTNTALPVVGEEPIVDIQTGVDMERDSILEAVDPPMAFVGPHGGNGQDAETFNITHRSPIDGSIINPAGNPNNPTLGFSPNPPPPNPALGMPGSLHVSSRFMESSSTSVVPPSMPREEDVLMSLQLLAYVSKYCELRTYFQESHLVPTLSIKKELHLLDDEPGQSSPPEEKEEIEEYLLKDDYNIFPLVEKFTVRHHSQEMQYWAGVVMRNLCRKDDSRGGIRQCAHYECGKWEEFTRQFAKCRRCRRTKYCSKECQKRAWVYHRHWCIPAQP